MSLGPQFSGVFERDTGQGRLFMSAREIMSSNEPWDLDRRQIIGGVTTAGWRDHDLESGMEFEEAHRQVRGSGYPDVNQDGEMRYYSPDGPSTLLARTTDMETNDQLYARKLDEARDSGLDWEIEEEGVKRPINLSPGGLLHHPGTVVNGHHRLAVAQDRDPDQLLPVQTANGFFDPSARY